MKTLYILASVMVVLFLGSSHKVEAQKKAVARTVVGTISGYECGDNCYLKVTDRRGKEHMGLCTAPLCSKWNLDAQMPDSYIGKKVRVMIGKGKQLDGSGTGVVGTMDAYTKILFLANVPVQPRPTRLKIDATDIHRVDFLNSTYQSPFCAKELEGVSETVTLSKGEFQTNDASFGVEKVIYGDMTGDAREEAIVPFGCQLTGANFSFTDIFVYTLKNGEPTLLAELNDNDLHRDYDRYYPNGYLQFEGNEKVRGRNLVVERYAEGSHARPKYIVTMNYHWNGVNLILSGRPQRRNTGF